jgi:dipeptidyl aminopeptidase/acylaminoacyl peptidase
MILGAGGFLLLAQVQSPAQSTPPGSKQESSVQEDWTVLRSESTNPAPGKMLYAYLQGQAKEHLDARRAALQSLKPEEIRRRQSELRAKLIEALGGFPSRTPLNARTLGRHSRAGYSVERVVYESRPDHHVTALFYLPEGRPPFPGVLVPCGHHQAAKAFEEYQRVCILMAKSGIAALCFDPISQGERVQFLGNDGKAGVKDNSLEHTMIGIGALLVGKTSAAYTTWDSIRSLDYLAGRPEIDAKRLGCTGNSGGGAMTGHLMALDDRIVAAAPDCSISNIGLERLFATFGPC